MRKLTDDERDLLILAATEGTGGVHLGPLASDTAITLWGDGLIHRDGSITARGRDVLIWTDRELVETIERGRAAMELAELDRLDVLCRRRPRPNFYDG